MACTSATRPCWQKPNAIARVSGGETVALTFDPHPARFFAPELAPPMLLSLHRRIEVLQQFGADVVLVEPFTTEFAALSAESFIETSAG
jgi:riboflavin kinase/FMN adenylyltransferase